MLVNAASSDSGPDPSCRSDGCGVSGEFSRQAGYGGSEAVSGTEVPLEVGVGSMNAPAFRSGSGAGWPMLSGSSSPAMDIGIFLFLGGGGG